MTDKSEISQPPPQNNGGKLSEAEVKLVCDAIVGIRHGWIQVFVQDGRLVQIDRLEKKRVIQDSKKPEKHQK